MTRVTKILFPPLLGYAAGGLVLSLAVHLGSLAGFQPPGGNVLIAGLNGGIFLLGLAMIIIAKMLPGTTDVTTDKLEASGLPGMSGVDELHGARVLHLCAREFCPVVLDEPAVHRDADAHHEPLFRCGRSFHRILERLFEHVDVGLFDWPRNPRDRSPRKQTCQRPRHGRWRAGQRKIEPAKF
jgi:hypothetical protein